MSDGPRLTTNRLLLRRWHSTDHDAFAAMNADRQVMEHFPATLSRADSDALVERIESGFAEHGYGLWALEVGATGEFIGFTGLAVPTFTAHFTPAVEIGWRLAHPAWGKGYATEAARAVLEFAFTRTNLTEIVSFTATTNLRSQAVMRRIGATTVHTDDFDHSGLPAGHRLRRHVLFRISRTRWHQIRSTH